jgi:hypothetical protein
MLERLHPVLLRWLRVPPDPEPPFGAPGSIRVFRAGNRFYHVRLARWAFAQLGTAVGIAFTVAFIAEMREEHERIHLAKAEQARAAAAAPAPTPPAQPPPVQPAPPAVAATDAEPAPTTRKSRQRRRGQSPQELLARLPPWGMTAIQVFELLGIIGFLLQLPVTFTAVRLDWKYRWYIVTDRSLRIRAGLWALQESTMSFANLQQVEVRQGPVQRLLGIADVRVQSAGGGSGGPEGQEAHDSLHTGIFHGVDNASEIRDLILERLRHFREAGLGDPDDAATATVPAAPDDALAAAREALAEARALRAAADGGLRAG